MGVPAARGVEADRPLALREGEDLVRREVDDLGGRIDERPDEPRAGDPVGLRVFASDPFHAPLLLRHRRAILRPRPVFGGRRRSRERHFPYSRRQCRLEDLAVMTATRKPSQIDSATRRMLAADLFNHVWTLLETP